MDKDFLSSLNKEKNNVKLSRSNTFTLAEVDYILETIKNEIGLSSLDEAKTVIAILFQQGGTARSCDGNMSITVFEKTVKLATIRKILKQCNYARGERKLARTLASDIYLICEKLEIPGNLSQKLKRLGTSTVKLEPNEEIWLSDFQNLNPSIPDKLRNLIEDSFKTKQPKQQKPPKKRK